MNLQHQLLKANIEIDKLKEMHVCIIKSLLRFIGQEDNIDKFNLVYQDEYAKITGIDIADNESIGSPVLVKYTRSENPKVFQIDIKYENETDSTST